MKYKILVCEDDPWIGLGAKALAQMGHEVCYFPFAAANSLQEIQNKIESFKPHFCFGRYYRIFDFNTPYGKDLEAYLEKQSIPFASWQFDNPESTGSYSLYNRLDAGPHPKNAVFFCTDKTHTFIFSSRGIKAAHLPHCIDADLENFTPNPQIVSRYQMDLGFVGSPPGANDNPISNDEFKIREMFRNNFLSQAVRFWEPFIKKFSSAEMPIKKNIILQAVEQFFEGWYFDVDSYQNAKHALTRELKKCFTHEQARIGLKFLDFIYSYYQLTVCLIRLQKKKIKIFGGDRWKSFLGDYQPQYERIDFSKELPSVFHAIKINFCLTKWQYSTAVHDRPLMVFASGGFALTDYRQELEEMFRPGEIISYRSFEEAFDLIDYYLAHETERTQAIKKARNRIFAEHTYHHRMNQVIESLRSFGI